MRKKEIDERLKMPSGFTIPPACWTGRFINEGLCGYLGLQAAKRTIGPVK